MDLIMCSLAISAVPPACRMQSALQAEEEFFVCKWSKREQTGAPVLLLAGQTGAIRVIDCHLREVAWVRKAEKLLPMNACCTALTELLVTEGVTKGSCTTQLLGKQCGVLLCLVTSL